MTVCMLISTFIGMFLYFHKDLQKHPYQLYALEILISSVTYSQYSMQIFNCWLGKIGLGEKLIGSFMLFLPHNTDERSKYDHVFYLQMISYNTINVSYALYYLVNAILYIDLYLIVTNPFYPQKKRNNVYNMIMITSSLFWIVFFNFQFFLGLSKSLFYTIYNIILVIFMMISIILMPLIMFRLLK